MKNAYEDTLEAIEEKKAEMQIKHGRVEYCADLDLCQDTTLDALVRDICQYPNLVALTCPITLVQLVRNEAAELCASIGTENRYELEYAHKQ